MSIDFHGDTRPSMSYGASHSKMVNRYILFILMTAFCFLPGLSCARLPANGTLTPTSTSTLNPTTEISPTAIITPVSFGSKENPFVLGLVTQPGGSPIILEAGIQLASRLSQETGYQVLAKEFTDYPSLFDALKKNTVHIVFLPPLTYIYAHQRDLVEVSLLTDHFGVFLYGTQFLANKADNFKPFIDEDTGANTAGSDAALQQFQGKRPCWTEPSSISGYIYPDALLKTNSIQVQDPAELQTHAGVIRALFVRGICDFGATFSILGDPRTSEYVSDLPGVLDQVQVIWRSDAIIPNLNVSFNTSIATDLRKIFSDAFRSIAQTEDGRKNLSDANNYDIKDLKEYPDSTYDPLRDAIQADKSPLILMLGK
jgi:phosphonate transport system substrate-binding protein